MGGGRRCAGGSGASDQCLYPHFQMGSLGQGTTLLAPATVTAGCHQPGFWGHSRFSPGPTLSYRVDLGPAGTKPTLARPSLSS